MNEKKNETSRAHKLTLNVYNICVLYRNRSSFLKKHIKCEKETKKKMFYMCEE
jgi:hypothetical protein